MGFDLEKINVFGLHGFLGQSADFYQFKQNLPIQYHLIVPDIFLNDIFDLTNFESVADQINEFVLQQPGKKIFIGYSLGGRIGLHVMKKYPNLFDQWVFLSTHPGLVTDAEKLQRIQNDHQWADKLNRMPWSNFMNEWNNQAVFLNQTEPIRDPKLFNKNQLTKALLNLSLGQQADMSSVIQLNQKKINCDLEYR